MIHPRIDSLLDHVDSHYAAVIVAAKRARQINNYYHTLGEGATPRFYSRPEAPPQGSRDSWSRPPIERGILMREKRGHRPG